MPLTIAKTATRRHLPGLTNSEQDPENPLRRVIRRAFRALPLRERCVLRLVYDLGASQRQLAGAMGVSHRDVRRMVHRARARATDPVQAALVAAWRRLTPQQRRLAYLHRFLNLSLRQIARHGMARNCRGEVITTLSTLRREMRRIMRKAGLDR